MSEPIITIVTGTINRLPFLQKMIASAYEAACGLSIDFIIIDSNSTDGTAEWCFTQPNIRYINSGEPRGAIRAFTDGGMMSKARYTLLANDDIEFLPYSILSAYRHLEDDPRCGAVAFADDRYGKFEVRQHWVQVNGDRMMYPYAQVGLFRTELMKQAGVWGADDPDFGGKGAYTYGGDNYLSSRLVEFGYHICSTELAKVHDFVCDDQTRERNSSRQLHDAHLFRGRFPSGACWKADELQLPHAPALRILYAPIFELGYDAQKRGMCGLRNAFSRVGDVIEVDYRKDYHELGVDGMKRKILNIIGVFNPHIFFTQLQKYGYGFDKSYIKKIRAVSPRTILINFNGDYWRDGHLMDVLSKYDLQLVVDHANVNEYKKHGVRARYWQISAEEPEIDIASAPAYDVLFLGNGYSNFRHQLVNKLYEIGTRHNLSVGVYGSGYSVPVEGNTLYEYGKNQSMMAKAKVVIGDMQFPDSDGYVSNRLFEALRAGACLLNQTVNNADIRLGLVSGVHYVAWDTLDDLDVLIPYYIHNTHIRDKVAQAGQKWFYEGQTFDHRVKQLLDMIKKHLNVVRGMHNA